MKIYAEQITREKALVYDMRAVVNGEARYFIIKVEPAKRVAFLRALEKNEGFRLEDYATVLHRGWNAPEDALKEALHKRYGMYQEVDV